MAAPRQPHGCLRGTRTGAGGRRIARRIGSALVATPSAVLCVYRWQSIRLLQVHCAAGGGGPRRAAAAAGAACRRQAHRRGTCRLAHARARANLRARSEADPTAQADTLQIMRRLEVSLKESALGNATLGVRRYCVAIGCAALLCCQTDRPGREGCLERRCASAAPTACGAVRAEGDRSAACRHRRRARRAAHARRG